MTYGFKVLIVIGAPHHLRVFRLMEVCKAQQTLQFTYMRPPVQGGGAKRYL